MGSAAHIKQDPRILPEPQLDITSSSRHHFIFLNETQRRLWYYPTFYTILHSHHLYAGLGSEPQPPSTTLTSRFAHEYPHPSHRAVLSGSTCRTPPSFSLVYTSLAQERFICACRSRSGCFLSTLLSAKNTLLPPRPLVPFSQKKMPRRHHTLVSVPSTVRVYWPHYYSI
jgi:hypothetical protein